MVHKIHSIGTKKHHPVITLFVAIMPWVAVVVLGKMLPKGEFPGSPTHVINKGGEAYR